MENTQENQATATAPDEVIQKAYQFVALSASISIQDAIDNLRGVNAICTTIIGTAMAQALEDPTATEQMQKIITMAQNIADNTAATCKRVNENATSLLSNFPRGNSL